MEQEARARQAPYNRQEQIGLYEEMVIGFMREVAAEGADKKVPKRHTPNQWQRKLDIWKAYRHLSLSTNELAEIFGVRRARIQQITSSVPVIIYENASEEIREKYTLENISMRKPSQSSQPDPVSLLVMEQVEKGITDRYQIAKNAGLTLEQIRSSAKKLRRCGIRIDPAKSHLSFNELKRQFEEEQDDKKLQNMLDKLQPLSIIKLAMRGRTEETSLSLLTNILKEAGFYVRSKELRHVADEIKNAGIPIRLTDRGYKNKRQGKEYSQVYMVVLTRHKDRIVQIIRQNPSLFERLSDNPVKLAYGPFEPDHYPKTTPLERKKDYQLVGILLRELFGVKQRQVDLDDLFADSPVPIYSIPRGRYYPKDQEDVLAAFLEEKFKKAANF